MSEPEPIILVVDDDPDAHFFLGRKLLEADVRSRMVVCDDGLQAIAYFQRCSIGEKPWPAIVFLDIKMPARTGFEVLQWLQARALLGHTVVAMFTTSTEPKDVTRAFSLGAHTFLNKDVKPEVLGPIVRSALKLAVRKAPEESL